MMTTRRCSFRIIPNNTSTMYSGALIVDPLSRKKYLDITSYTTSSEYEQIPFDAVSPEGSTRLNFLSYTDFWRRWINKFPKLIIISNALDVCDDCYIFRKY